MHLNRAYVSLSFGVTGRHARSTVHRPQRKSCQPGSRTSLRRVKPCAVAGPASDGDAKKPDPMPEKGAEKPISQDALKPNQPKKADEPAKPAAKPDTAQPKSTQAGRPQPQSAPKEAPKAVRQPPVQQRRPGSAGGQNAENDWATADNRPDRLGTSAAVLPQACCTMSALKRSTFISNVSVCLRVCRFLHHSIFCPWRSAVDNNAVPCNRYAT